MSTPTRSATINECTSLLRSKSLGQSSFSINNGTNPQMQTKLQQILRPKPIKILSIGHNSQANSAVGFAKGRSSSSFKIKSGIVSPATTFKEGQTPIVQSIILDHPDISLPEDVSRPVSKMKRVSILSSFDSTFGDNIAKPRNVMTSTHSTNFTSKASQKEFGGNRDDITSATPSMQNTTSQFFFRPKDNSSYPVSFSRISSPADGAEREFLQNASRKSSMHIKSASLSRIGTAPLDGRRKSQFDQKPSLSMLKKIDLDPDQRLAAEEYFEEMLGFYIKQCNNFFLLLQFWFLRISLILLVSNLAPFL